MHKHKWKIGDKWDHVDPHCRCGTGLSWTEAERYLNSHADLLEALKAVRNWIGPNSEQLTRPEIVEIMEQAIAKAKS